jgi:zinc/manganese transport system substrate-binding protein
MRTSTTHLQLFILMALLLGLTGCSTNRDAAGGTGKLKVVATYSVVGDLVRNITGNQVELTTLVGGDGDAHTFEPAPQDGVALAKASVIFENGVGFEGWLDRLYASSQSKARRVVVSKGLRLLDADDDHGHQHERDTKKQGDKHNKEEHDPHVWHDVQNAMHMVQVVRDELLKLDAANANLYNANAAAYLQQLKELDKWIVDQVATLPEANRKLVTSHDTFGYFANRYGFKVLGEALTSFTTESADPSAAEFATLCESIKAAKVPAIFAENVQNPKLMQRLAQEAGVNLAPPLYSDALGKEGSAGDSYIKMMRYNVTTIVTQLKP